MIRDVGVRPNPDPFKFFPFSNYRISILKYIVWGCCSMVEQICWLVEGMIILLKTWLPEVGTERVNNVVYVTGAESGCDSVQGERGCGGRLLFSRTGRRRCEGERNSARAVSRTTWLPRPWEGRCPRWMPCRWRSLQPWARKQLVTVSTGTEREREREREREWPRWTWFTYLQRLWLSSLYGAYILCLLKF